MATIPPYATRAQLKAELGIPATDTEWDAILADALDGATAFLTTQTGRIFAPTPEVRSYPRHGAGWSWSGDGGPCRLWLRADLAAVTSITPPSGTPLAADSYALGPFDRGPLMPGRCIDFAQGKAAAPLAIDGVWGFAETPPDVMLACMSMAARWWKGAKAGFATGALGLAELGTPIYARWATAEEWNVIKSYRVPVMA